MPLEKRPNANGGYDYVVIADPIERSQPPAEDTDAPFPEHATVLLTRGGVTQVIHPEAKE